MRIGRRGAAAFVLAAAASAVGYATAVRPRISRWGATDDETGGIAAGR